MRSVERSVIRRSFYVFFAWAVGLMLVLVLLDVFHSVNDARAHLTAEDSSQVFLPVVYYPSTPAGSYHCLEYEFGLIWSSETITLNNDGSSVYAYDGPYSDLVSGTWTFTPSLQEVGFTNFRWPTATYKFPNTLWASEYLQHVDFEIALHCSRQ